MADQITKTIQMKRSATPRELQNRAKNLPLSVAKDQATGQYKATVRGQEHLAAEAPTETEAVRAVKQLIDKQFLDGKLTINQKML